MFRIMAAWSRGGDPVRAAWLAGRGEPAGHSRLGGLRRAWLLDLVPEYRQHATVRRHPLVLAFIARHVIDGATEGARHGYRTTRSELDELVPPHVVGAALKAWRTEGRRMATTARAVGLVERALRGEVFKPTL